MTEARQIHEACVSAIAVRAEVLQARKTWLIVVIVLAAILGTVITALMLVHARNRRRNRKRNKATINNNTDGRGRSAPEDQAVPSGKMLLEVKL
jgi:heme/copper-type cytochrome/quinol oxidase subunit 2